MGKKYLEYNELTELFESIFNINNNEYVIGGRMTNKTGSHVDHEEGFYKTRIFAIDSVGEVKWSWESDPSYQEGPVKGLHRNKQNQWVYGTVSSIYVEETGASKHQPKFMVRDSAFNLVKEKILDEADYSYNFFTNGVQLSNGDWLGLGVNYEETNLPEGAQAHAYSWMIRMDGSGNKVWERKDVTFPGSIFPMRQYLYSAVELPGGSIIAAGYYRSVVDSIGAHGLLIKVNKNGCIDTLNCEDLVAISPPEATDRVLSVFPNPARSEVTFKFKENSASSDDNPEVGSLRLQIRNINGQLIEEFDGISAYNGVRWEADSYPSGIYFFNSYQKARLYKTEKSF